MANRLLGKALNVSEGRVTNCKHLIYWLYYHIVVFKSYIVTD